MVSVSLTKRDRISVKFDSIQEEQFVSAFLEQHCPTPIATMDAPYKYCATCHYCEWSPYRECRIFTMMRDGKIYG
jgi:hypothetical protein